MTAHHEIDKISGVSTTGHEWDGIKELNTPLPRWWLWTFYATIIWALLYYVVYPAWPLAASYTKGLWNYSSRADVEVELKALADKRAALGKGLETATVAQIKASPDLSKFAMAQGKAAFGDNCAPCHGSGAAGSVGYPNLNDDDWLWGGKLDEIQQTLTNGVRWAANDQTRVGNMTAFGKDGILKKEEIRTVANYVRSLSKLPTEQGADAAKGKELFAANCAVCHGDEAKGNKELGAPNLTDGIWLYGSSLDSIVETVTNGRAGQMPAWAGRLDPVTIKSLTVYVHSLGGGQQ